MAHRNLHASPHASIQSASCLAHAAAGQSDAPDEAHTPNPPQKHTHIYSIHAHQSSCDSWMCSKLPV